MLSQDEQKAITWLFPFLGETPIIFDVGSNKGHFSDVILNEYGDAVDLHLFEPVLKMLSFTEVKYEYRKNIKYNNNVVYKERNDKIEFFFFENYNNELSSIYKDNINWQSLPVKAHYSYAITLDEYCQSNKIDNIDYLKIDAEGADVDIILGSMGLIKHGKIKIIQIEYSEHYKRADAKFQTVLDIAKENGYEVYYFSGTNFERVNDFKEDYSPQNYFITKSVINNYSVLGWNNEFKVNTASFLDDKFDLVIECGSFEGKTTEYICNNLLNEGGRVIVIDPLLDIYYEGDNNAHPYFKDQHQRFLRNTRGLPVELKRGMAADEYPELASLRASFQYIDGNHWHPHPYNDGCWAFATTKIGGYILFDDFKWNESSEMSIQKFLDEFQHSFDLIIKDYQVLIKKTANQYNDITREYYK